MSHQVVWTKDVAEFFLEHCNATQFQRDVLMTRIAGMSVLQQSFFFSCSKSTVERTINQLKKMYDIVQKEHPDRLKPRVFSADELYMDTH